MQSLHIIERVDVGAEAAAQRDKIVGMLLDLARKASAGRLSAIACGFIETDESGSAQVCTDGAGPTIELMACGAAAFQRDWSDDDGETEEVS